MKNRFVLLIGLIVVGVLLAYMFCFQVWYNQTALVTRFGKVVTVEDRPGLKFRWPYPVNSVVVYDKRLRVLEDNLEQFQTADGYSIVARLYLAWRIDDPLKFYSNPKTPEEAEKRLKPLMQDLRKVVSGYRFDQLVNTDASQLQLDNVEKTAREALQAQLDQQQYGIDVQHVGIRRIVLPEAVTQQVFDRMKKTRERLAAKIEQDGKAEATRITSEAESMKNRILTFAQRRAQAIRTVGESEASGYYKAFQADEQLAIFLQRINALKEVLKKNTTYIIDINQLSEFNLFSAQPAPKQGQ